jgi:hypothetical protein
MTAAEARELATSVNDKKNGEPSGFARALRANIDSLASAGKFRVEGSLSGDRGKDPVFQEKLEYIYDLHWKEGYGSVIIQRKLGERGEYWSRKRIEKALAGERKRRRGLQDRLMGRSSGSPEVH